jgi:2-polyprenyl-3-methyl-5-hydroxy-6-metoxy-1,4-benzoquinol methylase
MRYRMLSISLKNIPDSISKLLTKNIDKRRIYTEDILINCPTPICLVGNAEIKHEFGNIINSYATVIRMNNYKIEGYEKYVGSKTDLRCVTGWIDLENRNEFVEFSPFTDCAFESKNVFNYNLKNKLEMITALSDIHKFIPEIANPSAGFALVQLFANLGIDVDLFGFDGFKTNHYWDKDIPINSTHSLKEIDFILRRTNVRLFNSQDALNEYAIRNSFDKSAKSEKNFFIKESYKVRDTLEYFVDLTSEESGVNYQPEVYPLAEKLGRYTNAKYIIDIGCGSGEKLVKLHPEFEIIGIDYGANIQKCNDTYKCGQWIDFDLESGLAIPIPQEILKDAIVINSDVIEHLIDPTLLVKNIKMVLNHAKLAIISTPDRELNWGKEHDGPPPNPTHIREWNIDEFTNMLDAYGFTIGCVGTTINNDKELEEKTILSVVVNEKLLKSYPKFDRELVYHLRPMSIYYLMNDKGGYEIYIRKKLSVKKYLSPNFVFDKMKKSNVIAIISAFNEGDIIYHVIGDLIENGIKVYLLDHNSTDDTVKEASKWLGHGLVHIENFPNESNYPEENKKQYVWTHILKRKEEIALTLGADWYIHADADEFRESPWPDLNLQEAISYVDALGYNAIDFTLLQFRPTNNNFVKGDVRQYLLCFEEGEDFNLSQIKAWKNLKIAVNLPKYGGHEVEFPNRKVFPIPFILRHYPIRNEVHGDRKIFQERIPRFDEEERNSGWHIQYDNIKIENPKFLYNESKLERYEPYLFKGKLLAAYSKNIIELLSLEIMNASSLQNKLSLVKNKVNELSKEVLSIDQNVHNTPGPIIEEELSEIWKEENPQLEKFLTIENKKPTAKALLELSEFHIKQQNYFDAFLLLQKILKEEPQNESALKSYACLLEQIEIKRKTKKWDAKKSTKNMIEAEKFIENQNLIKAKNKLAEILNFDLYHIEAINDLAVVNILEKNYEYASELLKTVLIMEPANNIAKENYQYIAQFIPPTEGAELKTISFNSFEVYKNYCSRHYKELTEREIQENSLLKGDEEFYVNGFCYSCGQYVDFKVDYNFSYISNNQRVLNWRERLVCPSCGMNNRVRAAIHFLKEIIKPQPRFSIYISEQNTDLYNRLKKDYPNLIGSEYLGHDIPWGGNNENGIRNEDITKLSFSDDSFDLALSFEVFDHVSDYKKAFSESFRILKKNGTLLFSVPFNKNSKKNQVRTQVESTDEITHTLPKEYLGNQLSKQGGLSFYQFGWEVLNDLRAAGFVETETIFVWSKEYGYYGGEQIFFVAKKSLKETSPTTRKDIPNQKSNIDKSGYVDEADKKENQESMQENR